MGFEVTGVTAAGRALLAQATGTARIFFVRGVIEPQIRTASEIESATTLPAMAGSAAGVIRSVTYSLDTTRVAVRFSNIDAEDVFHSVWLMARLETQTDSQAVPVCAVVSSQPVLIPDTTQTETYVDIYMSLSFLGTDGTVAITEGPAATLAEYAEFRDAVAEEVTVFEAEVRAEVAGINADMVTTGGVQTITGTKTHTAPVYVQSLYVGSQTRSVGLSCWSTWMDVAGSMAPSTTGSFDLGTYDYRWARVYADTVYTGTVEADTGALATVKTVSVANPLDGDTRIQLLNGELSLSSAQVVIGGTDITLEAASGNSIVTYSGIVPDTTSTRSLGSSSKKWAGVYATTFYGGLSGTATSATSASSDADGRYIANSYASQVVTCSYNGTDTSSVPASPTYSNTPTMLKVVSPSGSALFYCGISAIIANTMRGFTAVGYGTSYTSVTRSSAVNPSGSGTGVGALRLLQTTSTSTVSPGSIISGTLYAADIQRSTSSYELVDNDGGSAVSGTWVALCASTGTTSRTRFILAVRVY